MVLCTDFCCRAARVCVGVCVYVCGCVCVVLREFHRAEAVQTRRTMCCIECTKTPRAREPHFHHCPKVIWYACICSFSLAACIHTTHTPMRALFACCWHPLHVVCMFCASFDLHFVCVCVERIGAPSTMRSKHFKAIGMPPNMPTLLLSACNTFLTHLHVCDGLFLSCKQMPNSVSCPCAICVLLRAIFKLKFQVSLNLPKGNREL